MWSNDNFILAPKEINKARKRLLVSFVFIFSIFVGIFSQIISFPFQDKSKFLLTDQLVKNDFRAKIIDRNDNILAINVPAWTMYADPKEVLEPDKTAKFLHNLMPEKDLKTLKTKLTLKKRFVEIDRVSSPKRYQAIFNSGITGIHFMKIQTRVYPKGNLASHILGNVGRDGFGLAGIERKFDNVLKSSEKSLKLTINSNIQYILQTEIEKQIDFFEADAGAGIILSIKNGEILGLSSFPSFDVNYFGEASINERFNRATFGSYDMGSTFKLINTAIALDSGIVKLEDRFDTTKPLYIGKHKVDDFKYLKKPANVAEILINSSNIGSALIAEKVGAKVQKNYFDLLELTKKPDLPLLEISQPIFNHRWTRSNSMTASYGYGLAVSPIQLASAIACIFNNGNFIKPKLIIDNKKTIKKNVFTKNTSLIMRKLARAVVIHPDGSGKKSDAFGYFVGGKTGTAELIDKNGGFQKHLNLSSFVGAFPINDPQYLILVLIEKPKPQIEKLHHHFTTGGQVAAPVVKEIVNKIAPILNIHPIVTDLPKIEQALKLDLISNEVRLTNASF